MHRILIPVLLLLFLNSFDSKGQEAITGYGSVTVIKELQNEENRKYKLLITLPPKYEKEKRYKVLYYLDAWWLSELVKGSYGINYIANEIEEVILVGISSVGDEDEWNKQRNMDYTPSAYDQEKMKVTMQGGNVELNDRTTGGAEKFMCFLKEEIFKYVESEYKIEKETRGLLGHSFGGLFGCYSLINHNKVFKNYILISPSIWWNRTELLSDSKKLKLKSESNIFIVYGSKEVSFLIDPIKKMKNLLENNLEFKEYNGANHHSILPVGIYDGIKEIYSRQN